MNIETFLAHYQLHENPFGAEEARHDPVFDRLAEAAAKHPDFAKLMGPVDRPTTAVAFGEKGTGKTAIRLQIGRAITRHNREHPDRRVFLVPYDEFNPVLDNLMRQRKQDAEAMFQSIRLEDHQDAILSQAITRLVDTLLDTPPANSEPVLLPESLDKTIRRMPRQARVDLAVLAALYDQPHSGTVDARWQRLGKKLRLGARWSLGMLNAAAMTLTVVAAGLGLAAWLNDWEPMGLVIGAGVAAAGAVLGWGWSIGRWWKLWRLSSKVAREMPAVRRSASELRQMLGKLNAGDLARQPFPTTVGAGDSRYQLTRGFLEAVRYLGYAGMLVLMDRVDEPTLISGHTEKMKKLVWSMFDNKFLQQERVGIKMLLPIELRHEIHRASPDFFQEARLDKQSMVDRLSWSGATLYDLCSHRLSACRPEDAEALSVTDLFEQDVTRAMVVDALDQMHQPRDAFKFLYSVIQEHCRIVPEAEAEQNFKIPRLTLENVRRQQSQRVQELYRGLSPS